jgi:hypothetical protein
MGTELQTPSAVDKMAVNGKECNDYVIHKKTTTTQLQVQRIKVLYISRGL